MYGRNSQNSVVIVPRQRSDGMELKPGDQIVKSRIDSATPGSLQGRAQ
jgi:hypothetical protein